MRISDWSSDVCSSDLTWKPSACTPARSDAGRGLGGSASADGGLGTDLARGGLVRDRIDDTALFEIDHEERVDLAVDRRQLALMATPGVEPLGGGAESGSDTGAARAAAGHGGFVTMLNAAAPQAHTQCYT